MKKERGLGFLHYGILVTCILSVLLFYNLFKGDKGFFLPGEMTQGHHQIEMQCSACHVASFDDGEQMQQACMDCHGDALEKARDTHPKKKFTDPRNAELLANLDATQCATCHVEHAPEITGEFGVTMPEDFCFYCHQTIAEDRPSHADYDYASCSDAGCHNYHDNKALYEQFLAKHLDEPDVLSNAALRVPNAVALWHRKNQGAEPLTAIDHDGSGIDKLSAEVVEQWSGSVHAEVQVNCSGCHDSTNWSVAAESREPEIAIDSCAACHERQLDGFKSGLHGMRINANMAPMKVQDARLAMHTQAGHRSLTCASCHDPHQPDLRRAAADACLECHDDTHSRNYQGSAHSQLWKAELAGELPAGSGVSCASCHMPRIKKGKLVFVEHNQSQTLEPNSKMIRPVCLHCHGLEFSVAALTDRQLIDQNFAQSIGKQHPGFVLVRERLAIKKAARKADRETN